MKLTKLFVMGVLVGSVAVIGCSDDPAPVDPGTGGTGGGTGGTGGGTGGTGGGADPCTGDFCDSQSEPKAACEAAIEFCNTDPDVDLTEAECDAAGNFFCTQDFSGAGGAGGDGGTGGTSGGNCDYGDCVDGSAEKEACEASVAVCLGTPFLPPAVREACVEGANLDQCGDPDML